MTDEKKVVDLAEERLRRDHEEGHRAHDRGEAFSLKPYVYDEDGIGFIEGDMPITIILDPENLTGICLTKEDALKLGVALCECAEEGEVHPVEPEAG
jgi:hypothetical protein